MLVCNYVQIISIFLILLLVIRRDIKVYFKISVWNDTRDIG